MSIQQTEQARLAELAIGDALGDLSAEELLEYAAVRSHHHTDETAASVRTVAAALQASIGALEPMPEALARRVERAAPALADQGFGVTARVARSRSMPAQAFAYGGWLAAAATVLVVLFFWRSQPVGVTQVPQTAVAASVERASLLATGRLLVKANWSSGGDASGVEVHGDVIWDPVRQTGYMRFSGLAKNNPSQQQYQLWIFDKTRDQRYPVDGGTFDVDANGEVVIRIRARLHIDTPTLFAVTVEQPGGVVVSSRARMAAVAQTG